MRLDLQGLRQEPVVFGACRGALHLSPSGEARAAVVICQPLGRDAQPAYRPLWLLAQEMAALGFAVLRYDHPGAGDSAPLPDGTDAWPQWVSSAVQAARFVRERTGAARLVMAGLRMGATVAACASQEAGADALALWSPVVAGRTWLRELRFAASIADPGRREREDGGLDASSLLLSAQTLRSLQALRLDEIDPPAPQILIAGGGQTAALASRFEAGGAQVAVTGFEESDELFRESYVNAPPRKLFGVTLGWLQERARAWPSARVADRATTATLSLAEAEERAVVFGAGLRGVLCLPRAGGAGRRAALFPNTGGDPRAGNGGFAARAARRLASEGIASLRFDLAGLGESDFDAEWRSHVYETNRAADFAAAADLLAGRGYSDLVVVGVCSGAYHGVRVAISDPRFGSVFAVNPAFWVWRRGAPLVPPGRNEVSSSRVLARRLARLLLTPRRWTGGPAGQDRPAAAAAVLWRRVRRNLVSAWRLRHQTRRLRSELARLERRGGRLRILVGLTDIALDRLELHFGRRGRWLRRQGFETTFAADLDHGLTLVESQEQVVRALLAFSRQPVVRHEAATSVGAGIREVQLRRA